MRASCSRFDRHEGVAEVAEAPRGGGRRREPETSVSSRSSTSRPSGRVGSASSCPRSRRFPCLRRTTCAASRTARSRSSSAARIGTSPSACWGSLATSRVAGGVGAEAGVAATEIGDAVHRLLETVPLDAPVAPARDELDRTVREWYPSVTESELARIAGLVDAYCSSAAGRRARNAARRAAGAALRVRARRRSPPRSPRRPVAETATRALVVDYKSNVLDGAEPAEVVEDEYELQRLVYALACLRAGAEEVEVAYQFLERPDDVVSSDLRGGRRRRRSRRTLSAAIARIRAGEFTADAERVRLRGLPRARPRLRRAAAGMRSVASRVVRVAALSDIHGNLPALEAVLADVESRAGRCDRRSRATASPARGPARCSSAPGDRCPRRPRQRRPARPRGGRGYRRPGGSPRRVVRGSLGAEPDGDRRRLAADA